MAARHGEQVAHGHRLQVVADLGWELVGEELDDGVCQGHLSLGNGEAHGCGGKGLTDGMEHVGHAVGTLAPPVAVDDAAISHDHHAVDVHRVGGCLLEETFHGGSDAVGGFCTGQIDDLCRFLHTVLTCRQCHQHQCGQINPFRFHLV